MKALFKGLDRAGAFLEDALLIGLLISMMLLSTSQILSRELVSVLNFFSISGESTLRELLGAMNYAYGDEALRMMVLWLTLAGAMAASRDGRQISIALLDRFLAGRSLALAHVVTNLFTAAVCGIIGWYSIELIQSSLEFDETVLGGKPAWIFQLILPVGFGVMCLHHLAASGRQMVLAVKGEPQE